MMCIGGTEVSRLVLEYKESLTLCYEAVRQVMHSSVRSKLVILVIETGRSI